MKYLYILFLPFLLSSCSKADSASSANSTTVGVSGSLARFAISSDHLYTVSPSQLTTYDVSAPHNPVFQKKISLGFGVETIFPYKNNLFIGTEFGMKIMDITNPENPTLVSDYQHIRSCDPVVANDKYAFITLRSDAPCTRGLNQLQFVDISNLAFPKLVVTYPLTQPYGLAIDGQDLFICDGGIKHYNISDVKNISLIKKTVIEATDVIAKNGILMVIGKDGLYQYDYSGGTLQFLSKIPTI